MKSENYRERILEVTFQAYDKTKVEFFYDSNIEQASNYIWKNICATAVILYAWEYHLNNPKQIKIEKKKVNDEELNKLYKK